MKGRKKQFSRYLNSEYNDFSLEPRAKEDQNSICSLLRDASNKTHYKSNEAYHQSSSQKALQQLYKMVPLTYKIIRSFAGVLSGEALEFVHNIKLIQQLDNHIFEAHKALYAKYQTVPVIFLSHAPGKAVYVWQVNKLCPYIKRYNHMILDSRSLLAETIPTISILMLAKINPEDGEEIVGASFVGDSCQIAVSSRVQSDELAIRFYKLTDFHELARVNPFRQQILGNGKHYFKLVFKNVSTADKTREKVDIGLWKSKTEEELQKEQKEQTVKEKLLQTNSSLESFLSPWHSLFTFQMTENGVVVLVDHYSLGLVAWKEDKIYALSCKIDKVWCVKVEKNNIFIRAYNKSVLQIMFEKFPDVSIVTHTSMDDHFFNELNMWKQGIKFQSQNLNYDPVYEDSGNLIYDIPISVVNPSLIKVKTDMDNQGKEIKEKEQEEISVKSIDKIKRELRQKRTGIIGYEANLKFKKDILKDIRAHVSIKMGKIKKYEDEYQENEKQEERKKKVLEEPERISKELIELYKEIKLEKKRMEKERENLRKRRRYHRFEIIEI